MTEGGAIGGKRLPTAVVPAGAERTTWVNLYVSELTCHSTIAAQKLTIGKDPGADTFRDIDHNQIVHTIAIAKPYL